METPTTILLTLEEKKALLWYLTYIKHEVRQQLINRKAYRTRCNVSGYHNRMKTPAQKAEAIAYNEAEAQKEAPVKEAIPKVARALLKELTEQNIEVPQDVRDAWSEPGKRT